MAESKVIPKKRKGRKKKVIAVSLVGVLAAGGIGGALYYKQNSAVKMPEDTRQAQSATAELGSISNTIVGTGNLYIHEPLEITGTTGTVSAVNVSENESVTSGTELLTLENSASDAHYEQLLAQREAYSATLKKLLQLSKNQKITADISGTIQSVNVSASSSDSSSSTSSGSAGSSGSVNVSKMSYAASTGKNTDSGKSKNSSVNNNISASENRKTKVPAVSFTVNCDNRTAAKTISNSQAGIIGLSSTMQMPAGTSYKIITLSSENTDENETVENIEKITDQEEQTQAEAAASECSNEEDVDAFAADAEENAESSADMVSAGFK